MAWGWWSSRESQPHGATCTLPWFLLFEHKSSSVQGHSHASCVIYLCTYQYYHLSDSDRIDKERRGEWGRQRKMRQSAIAGCLHVKIRRWKHQNQKGWCGVYAVQCSLHQLVSLSVWNLNMSTLRAESIWLLWTSLLCSDKMVNAAGGWLWDSVTTVFQVLQAHV
jgi:hypothetical protein